MADIEKSFKGETTKWVGVNWIPLPTLLKRLATWPDLPLETVEALAILACLCTKYPGKLLKEQREQAIVLRRAAEVLNVLSGSGAILVHGPAVHRAATPSLADSWVLRPLMVTELCRLADLIALPLELAVDVTVVVKSWDKSKRRPAFTLRPAVESDPTLMETFALLGRSLLAHYAPPPRKQPPKSASEIVAQAMDLVIPLPKGVERRDAASVDKTVRRGRQKWKHEHRLDDTRELLLNFRLAFKGELGVFVDEKCWNQWRPDGGLP